MRVRFNKRKGSTLIEVLISITIFSIVSIPLSMAVVSAIGNNKKGEYKQYAVASAQQIVEGLRANNTTTPNIVTIKTDTTYNLNFLKIEVPSTGHDISYIVSDQNVGNGLTANVTFERKLLNDGASVTNNVVYDLNILMNSDSIIVTGTNNFTGITGDVTYSLTNDLKICNNNDNTIKFQDNTTNNVLGGDKAYYISKDGIIDNIKISYSSDYGSHEIHLENNTTNPLSVYIFKEGNVKANTCSNLNGSIKLYDDLSSAPVVVDNTSGIYDISVDIFKGESPNKVKVYSTKTSISLGT